jgi:hypothetical protein
MERLASKRGTLSAAEWCYATGRYAAEHWAYSHPSVRPCDVYPSPKFICKAAAAELKRRKIVILCAACSSTRIRETICPLFGLTRNMRCCRGRGLSWLAAE